MSVRVLSYARSKAPPFRAGLITTASTIPAAAPPQGAPAPPRERRWPWATCMRSRRPGQEPLAATAYSVHASWHGDDDTDTKPAKHPRLPVHLPPTGNGRVHADRGGRCHRGLPMARDLRARDRAPRREGPARPGRGAKIVARRICVLYVCTHGSEMLGDTPTVCCACLDGVPCGLVPWGALAGQPACDACLGVIERLGPPVVAEDRDERSGIYRAIPVDARGTG